MIAVCEPQCTGLAHESHNAGTLLALQNAYPEQKILFFAEQTHIDAIQYCFTLSGNTLKQIEFIPVDLATLRSSYLDYSSNKAFFQALFTRLVNTGITHLILLSTHTTSLLALKMLKKRSFPQMSFSIFLHGVVEAASQPISWKLVREGISSIWLQNFRYTVKFLGNADITYIALSAFAFANMQMNTTFCDLPLRYLPLPIIFHENNSIFTRPTLTFATIGKGNPEAVRQLSQRLVAMGHSAFQIKVLGYFPDTQRSPDHVLPIAGTGRLSREKLSRHMEDVDVLLFFYDKSAYTYSQSGAFMEIFQYNKPALFLENRGFHYLNSLGHPFAKECESLEHMAGEAKKLIERDENGINEFKHFQKNITLIRKEIDPCLNKNLIGKVFFDKIASSNLFYN